MRRLGAPLILLMLVLILVSGTAPTNKVDPLAARIFNASRQAQGGDVIYLQGAHFDPSTRVLYGGAANAMPLPIVSRVEQSYLAVKLPDTLSEQPILRVVNEHGAAPTLRLNGATPHHIDATRIVPGGKFRLFGRNLMVKGSVPHVLINSLEAVVDTGSSDETMLVVTAPTALKAGTTGHITTDNGNGTGQAGLDREVAVIDGSGDPLALGVGWGAGFNFADRIVEAPAACDGVTDDTQTINQAVTKASQTGGAIVRLPAGTCRLTASINMAPRVVLKGAGQDETLLRYEANYPVYAEGLDLIGLQDLQLINAGPVQEGVSWKNNTRSVIQRTALRMGKSRQWFLTGNENFVFDRNVIEQTASYDLQNPYRFDSSSGMVFSNNRSINTDGSPTFRLIHDSFVVNNHFTRDATSQNEKVVIAHHGFVIDFASRITVVGNVFDVAHGPVVNTERNDGETILVEGGGPSRTEKSGTVSAATPDTLTASDVEIDVNPFGSGLPENLAVVVVSGEGAGQARRVVSVAGTTLTIDHPWDIVPDAGSHIATFVWALEATIIKANILKDNPRGIWLYHSAINDILIDGNSISEGGGIYLRTFQDVSNQLFTPQLNTTVSNNTIVNDTGRWIAYIILAAVRKDAEAFGISQFGIEIRRNTITAHVPNATSLLEEYASHEGYASLVRAETEAGKLEDQPAVIGTIFQGNDCRRCERAYTIEPGAEAGSILDGNQPRQGN